MLRKEIIVQLNDIVEERFEIDKSVITEKLDVRKTLDLDSMRAMELIVIIKKQFGIQISPRHLSLIVTFGDIYDYIEQHKNL